MPLALLQAIRSLIPRSPATGLCLGTPILLEGPPGSGKSALIEHVAALTGNALGACAGLALQPPCAMLHAARRRASRAATASTVQPSPNSHQPTPTHLPHPHLPTHPPGMVRIHLDDQMDSKALMGAYVCTARPGEFVWQPGPLTQAVAQGRWVLVEDANLAPPEVGRSGGGRQEGGSAGSGACRLGRLWAAMLPACHASGLHTLPAFTTPPCLRCWLRWCRCWSAAHSTLRRGQRVWRQRLASSSLPLSRRRLVRGGAAARVWVGVVPAPLQLRPPALTSSPTFPPLPCLAHLQAARRRARTAAARQ